MQQNLWSLVSAQKITLSKAFRVPNTIANLCGVQIMRMATGTLTLLVVLAGISSGEERVSSANFAPKVPEPATEPDQPVEVIPVAAAPTPEVQAGALVTSFARFSKTNSPRTAPKDKLDAAQAMADKAQALKDEPAIRFALLRQAALLAAQSGNLHRLFRLRQQFFDGFLLQPKEQLDFTREALKDAAPAMK